MVYINRGRDVFNMMQAEGEKGMRKAIIKLAEDNAQLNDQMREMMAVMDKIVDQVVKAQLVSARLIEENAKLKAKFYPDTEGNPDNENQFN